MANCPYCDFEGEFTGLKSWKFRFYDVRMLKCPRCGGVFNHYSGLSPRSGRASEFTIKLKPGVAVASNTYRDEDHHELPEPLSKDFNVTFIGSTPKGSVPAQKPVTVAPPVQQQVVVERRFDSGLSSIRPSREVLEGVVAKVLRDLGFKVQTNVRLPAKGGEVEVDVWAFKSVGGSQFRVYVSCKNWDKDVNRHIVDQEFGRVLQLDYMPHLRILVVRSLTEPARKAALDDGFMVIELGEKASTENSQEIYELVYSKLKEIFIGITPDKVKDAVVKLKNVVEDLESLYR